MRCTIRQQYMTLRINEGERKELLNIILFIVLLPIVSWILYISLMTRDGQSMCGAIFLICIVTYWILLNNSDESEKKLGGNLENPKTCHTFAAENKTKTLQNNES